MIAYKWVYKKGNKYYSLMNYGYCRMTKDFLTNQPPYEVGKIYDNHLEASEFLKNQLKRKYAFLPNAFVKSGFYFWNKKIPIRKPQKKSMKNLGADINAILECEIQEEDIIEVDHRTRWGKSNKIATAYFNITGETTVQTFAEEQLWQYLCYEVIKLQHNKKEE